MRVKVDLAEERLSRWLAGMQRVFPDALCIRALGPVELRARGGAGEQCFELLEPFRYRSALVGELVIPAGFRTDFGSVPGWARWYVDDDSVELLYPSLPHDWLYACGGTGLGWGAPITRQMADAVLREAMQTVGARADQVAVVHAAVRLGGRRHWRAPREQ